MSQDLDLVTRELTFSVTRKGEFLMPTGQVFPCSLGKAGLLPAADKREGDGATPTGRWPLRRVFYRPDREPSPQTALPIVPIGQHDGWCDAPHHPLYNRPVTLPFRHSHECLWRDDHVYDLIVELGHNDDPPVPGLGSAVFMHLTRPDRTPTEGCVALDRDDFLQFLMVAPPGAILSIG